MNPRTSKAILKLALRAREARRSSVSPYSRFRVGAALLCSSGRVYTGCNVENSSYGLTICAERTALVKAVSEGERRFTALAIVSDSPDPTPPCGACRQVIMELAGDIDIILIGKHRKVRTFRMSELLPHAFSKDNIHS
jgi:cytidine deaminase